MPVRRGVGHPMKLQQVSNRNFLSIVGFKFVLNRCPKVDFLCNSANLPMITLGVAEQASYLRNIPVPGDKLQYDDLRITSPYFLWIEFHLKSFDDDIVLAFPFRSCNLSISKVSRNIRAGCYLGKRNIQDILILNLALLNPEILRTIDSSLNHLDHLDQISFLRWNIDESLE